MKHTPPLGTIFFRKTLVQNKGARTTEVAIIQGMIERCYYALFEFCLLIPEGGFPSVGRYRRYLTEERSNLKTKTVVLSVTRQVPYSAQDKHTPPSETVRYFQERYLVSL